MNSAALILHIRLRLLGLDQTSFAKLVGVAQSTVCKWENGKGGPRLDDLARIRAVLAQRKIRWKDSWFFEQQRFAA